ASQQAIRLDPNHVDGYTALGQARNYRGLYVQSEDFFKQALSLDSGNPDALNLYGSMLANVGRLKDSLRLHLQLRAQEPLVPTLTTLAATVPPLKGLIKQEIAIRKALPPPNINGISRAEVCAWIGRYGKAADVLREISPGPFPPGAVEEAVRLLRAAPAKVAS